MGLIRPDGKLTFEAWKDWTFFTNGKKSHAELEILYQQYLVMPPDEFREFDDDEDLADWEDGIPDWRNNPQGD